MVGEGVLRRLALDLPDAEERDHHGFPSFCVAGRIFSTLRVDPPRLMVKLSGEDQHNLIMGHPDVVTPVPGYWGRKGSTFVDYARIDEALAASLLGMAWANVAPARLRRARPQASSS